MVPEGTHLRENRCKNLGKWQTISGTLLGVAAPQGVVRDLPVLGALRLVTEVSLGSKPDMQELGAAGKPSAAPKECPNRPLLPPPPNRELLALIDPGMVGGFRDLLGCISQA